MVIGKLSPGPRPSAFFAPGGGQHSMMEAQPEGSQPAEDVEQQLGEGGKHRSWQEELAGGKTEGEQQSLEQGEGGGGEASKAAEPPVDSAAARAVQVVRASRAFASALDEVLVGEPALRVALKEALHPESVGAAFGALDLRAILSVERAAEVFRAAGSYEGPHSWIEAPEAGVRGLVAESLQICSAPMLDTLARVHAVLVEAAGAAAAKCGGGSDSSSEEGGEAALLLEALQDKAKLCLGKWKTSAAEQLQQLLDAEMRFPTAASFAALKAELARLLQQEEAAATAQAEGGLAAEAGAAALPAKPAATPAKPAPTPHAAPAEAAEDAEKYQCYWMGWLEKLNRRGKWQRRWCVISEERQSLWYFSHPNERPARAMVSLKGVTLVEGLPDSGPHQKPSGASAAPELAFQLQHLVQVEKEGALLTPATVTLRCPDLDTKQEWMRRIMRIAVGPKPAPVPLAAAEEGPKVLGGGGEEEEEGELEQGAGSLPRRISTRVYPAEELQQGTGGRGSESGSGSTGEDLSPEEWAEAEAEYGADEVDSTEAAAAAALWREIAKQAAEQTAAIDAEQRQVLECVLQGTRAYVQAAHARLADATCKLVSSTMLGRGDDLYCSLLSLLVEEQ